MKLLFHCKAFGLLSLQSSHTMFSGLGDVSNLFAAAAAANLHSLSVSASAAAPAPTSSIPTSELSAAAADQLGLSGADASNATVESATAGIAAVHEELEAIPISDKAAYAYAQQTKPELVGDEEVFKFLLAENFDAPVRYGSTVIMLHSVI